MPKDSKNMMIYSLLVNTSFVVKTRNLHKNCSKISDKLGCHSIRYVPKVESLTIMELTLLHLLDDRLLIRNETSIGNTL